MNTLHARSLANCLIALLLLTACNKKKDEDAKPRPPATGVVTRTGGIMGALITKQIGPEGGTIGTPQGSILVTIPAGALTGPVTVGLQPIENTNPGGIATGYRLTPHGTTFKKPVTITFSYEDAAHAVTYAPALGVAYQDDKGVWNYIKDPAINTANKTVSVQSTHFSDWTLMLWMFLTPQTAEVNVNEQLPLKAVRVLPATLEDGILVPLVPAEGEGIPVGEQVLLEKKYIKKWELIGSGALEIDGPQAFYFAPGTVPAQNPVAVTLSLNLQSAAVTLISAISVQGSVLEMEVASGDWKKYDATIVKNGNLYNILSTSDDGVINLQFTGGLGPHPYSNGDNTQTQNSFSFSTPDASASYKSFYIDNGNVLLSNGNINITNMGDTEGYVTGVFTVTPAGLFSSLNGQYLGNAIIQGKFRVKKSW